MRIIKPLVLFSIGGLLYICCELVFRGHTHWSMFLVGGLCFLLVGGINEIIPWSMKLRYQGLIGATIITAIEFASGCVLNIWLGWAVWDYSDMPFNVLGQICLPFTAIWFFIAQAAIIIDDYLRYWLFGEEKPHYQI